jgi:hypothetical protein
MNESTDVVNASLPTLHTHTTKPPLVRSSSSTVAAPIRYQPTLASWQPVTSTLAGFCTAGLQSLQHDPFTPAAASRACRCDDQQHKAQPPHPGVSNRVEIGQPFSLLVHRQQELGNRIRLKPRAGMQNQPAWTRQCVRTSPAMATKKLKPLGRPDEHPIHFRTLGHSIWGSTTAQLIFGRKHKAPMVMVTDHLLQSLGCSPWAEQLVMKIEVHSAEQQCHLSLRHSSRSGLVSGNIRLQLLPACHLRTCMPAHSLGPVQHSRFNHGWQQLGSNIHWASTPSSGQCCHLITGVPLIAACA